MECGLSVTSTTFVAVYRVIESLISRAISGWNKVYMRTELDLENPKKGWNVSFGRFELLKASHLRIPGTRRPAGDCYFDLAQLNQDWNPTEDAERRFNMEDIILTMRKTPEELWGPSEFSNFYSIPICLRLRDFVHPEPVALFTPEDWVAGKNVGRVLTPKSPNQTPIPE